MNLAPKTVTYLKNLDTAHKKDVYSALSIIISNYKISHNRLTNLFTIPLSYFEKESIDYEKLHHLITHVINRHENLITLINETVKNNPKKLSWIKICKLDNKLNNKWVIFELEHNNTKKLDSLLKIINLRDKNENNATYDSRIIKSLPPKIFWENIELKLLNIYDLEILANKKTVLKSTYDKMGFAKTNSNDKTPKKSWEFLLLLSTNKGKFNLSTDIKNIKNNIIKDKEVYRQYKKQLSDILKLNFGLEDDPFFSYKEKDSYQTKFKILPPPNIRGGGEIYGVSDTNNDYLPKV